MPELDELEKLEFLAAKLAELNAQVKAIPKPLPYKACLHCHKRMSAKKKHSKFCSVECRDEAWRLAHPLPTVPHPEVTCETCGTLFVRKSTRHRYCSPECCPTVTVAGPERKAKKCKHCGETFVPRTYNAKYCQKACTDAAFQAKSKKKASH